MGADEAGTFDRLMATRRVIEDRLATHGGRVAGTAGDAVLAVFESVVEALSAALSIQQALAEREVDQPEDRRLSLRIGLNLGDVIVEGDDVFGEGVNVAARIEALAPSGGIAVSGAVRDQVGARLPVSFTDLGEQALKNIAGPVRVFSVAAGSAPASRPPRRPQRMAMVMGAAALTLVGLGALTLPTLLERIAPGNEETVQTGRPVIAVLPFDERGTADGERYFADGVTEDVIGALGRFSGLVVLSWSAVAPYRDAAPAPTEIGATLGAGYVVSGSLQRADGRVRVSVQISDAADGTLIWSERYDKEIADIFAVQDAITERVVNALAVRVTEVERSRALSVPTANLSAYDAVLRGRDAFRQVQRGSNVEAQDLFQRAIDLDPDYAEAYVELGWSLLADFKFGWTQWPGRTLERAGAAAEQAIALDSFNASAYAVQADVRKFYGDLEGAERAIDRALELNPNNAMAHGIRASLMAFEGRADEAVAAAETAFRLDPSPRAEWIMSLMTGYFLQGRYADVLDAARRHASIVNDDATHLAVLAMAHGMLGNEAEALETARQVRRKAPFFDGRQMGYLIGGEEHRETVIEGLRRAGLL
jgi:TolB-like protein